MVVAACRSWNLRSWSQALVGRCYARGPRRFTGGLSVHVPGGCKNTYEKSRNGPRVGALNGREGLWLVPEVAGGASSSSRSTFRLLLFSYVLFHPRGTCTESASFQSTRAPRIAASHQSVRPASGSHEEIAATTTKPYPCNSGSRAESLRRFKALALTSAGACADPACRPKLDSTVTGNSAQGL